MSIVSREQIDQIRSSVDFVGLVREYVPSLKVMGRSVRGLCPFHVERTPSFHVHPEKGLFKCFGCGESGDVISFFSKIENVSFVEALEKLAPMAGVQLRRSRQPGEVLAETEKEKIYRALEKAEKFYEGALWDDFLGRKARQYLEERGLTEETVRNFHVGLAPPRGPGCFEFLVKKGFPIEICLKAGIVMRSSSGHFYDPVGGRLVFPIRDSFGHVVGFGGRVLPEGLRQKLDWDEDGSRDREPPKYINSPETLVFSKGKLLYGLDRAKSAILGQHRILLLEGYMDVIMAHQEGVGLAVATLGTAFTRDHARLVKRYANEVIAFFDPDEAGRKAALRGIEPVLQEDLFPRIVMAKDSRDPDEFIREEGSDSLMKLVDQSPDFLDYILQITPEEMMSSLKGKTQTTHYVLSLLNQSPNEILRAEWMGRLSLRLGIQREALGAELKRMTKRTYVKPSQEPTGNTRTWPSLPTAEDEYFQILLNLPSIGSPLDLSPVDFVDPKHKKLLELIQEQVSENGKISLPDLCEAFSHEEKDWVLQLVLEEKEFPDPEERKEQLVQDIKRKRDKDRLNFLSHQIAQGKLPRSDWREFQELLKRVKGSSKIPVAQ